MKLHLFTAPSNHKAIAMIHSTFGPDALIYKTRSVPEGVEILAGPPTDQQESTIVRVTPIQDEVWVDDAEVKANQAQANLENEMIAKMNTELQYLTQTLNNLTRDFNTRLLEGLHLAEDDHAIKSNYIYYYLNKLGFRGKFCRRFAGNFLRTQKANQQIDEQDIMQALLRSIKTCDLDAIEERTVCALVGPTGVGKTTTIAKLANRYIENYDADTLGLITTDYKDIAGTNRLFNFSRLANVDVEFVSSIDELSDVLETMKNKHLILIDTHGVSQRDNEKLTALLELLESQGDAIQTYITLPSTVQEPVLDEIARAFNTPNLRGCILTKQDECISLAPAVSVCVNYKLRIAYICNGQDIDHDIDSADAKKIMQQIASESSVLKQLTDTKLESHLDNKA